MQKEGKWVIISNTNPIIYALSDSIGGTAESVIKATVSQFTETKFDVIRIPYINNKEQKRLPFPIVGHVKCGMKSDKGYPMSTDYFIPDGNYAPLFKQAYGEKPSTIQIVFPSDDAELVCREEYVLRDGQGKLVATGDGETFKTWSEKAKKYIIVTTTEQPDIMAMLEKHYKQDYQ